jgi:hypothetical protein
MRAVNATAPILRRVEIAVRVEPAHAGVLRAAAHPTRPHRSANLSMPAARRQLEATPASPRRGDSTRASASGPGLMRTPQTPESKGTQISATRISWESFIDVSTPSRGKRPAASLIGTKSPHPCRDRCSVNRRSCEFLFRFSHRRCLAGVPPLRLRGGLRRDSLAAALLEALPHLCGGGPPPPGG